MSLKSSCHKNAIYLRITAQKTQVGGKLYWNKIIIPDGNSNPQEQMINKKVDITNYK